MALMLDGTALYPLTTNGCEAVTSGHGRRLEQRWRSVCLSGDREPRNTDYYRGETSIGTFAVRASELARPCVLLRGSVIGSLQMCISIIFYLLVGKGGRRYREETVAGNELDNFYKLFTIFRVFSNKYTVIFRNNRVRK